MMPWIGQNVKATPVQVCIDPEGPRKLRRLTLQGLGTGRFYPPPLRKKTPGTHFS